jgi:hypothetical protein
MTSIRPGNTIYHYCKLSTAIEMILPKRELLLNSILKTNDPREYQDFVFSSIYYPDLMGNLNERNKIVNKILRDDCKVICFSLDYKHYWGNSYSKMWAHYGDNHKGICLEIDKSEFIEENQDKIVPECFKEIKYWNFDIRKRIKHKTVDYTQVKKDDLEHYVKMKFRKRHLRYLFFTKNKEWESEREMRLVYFSTNKDNEYCSIKRSLKNIYLGLNFNDKNLNSLIELTSGIDIYKMEYGDIGLRNNLQKINN